ncbi:MAG: hypothetical protein Q9227_005484 [Pyrenula ochraceoflavens]
MSQAGTPGTGREREVKEGERAKLTEKRKNILEKLKGVVDNLRDTRDDLSSLRGKSENFLSIGVSKIKEEWQDRTVKRLKEALEKVNKQREQVDEELRELGTDEDWRNLDDQEVERRASEGEQSLREANSVRDDVSSSLDSMRPGDTSETNSLTPLLPKKASK